MVLFLGGLIGIYLCYLQEKWLWSSTQNYFCYKYKGHCEYCDCWSCVRKEYIDQYKNNISKEYLKFYKGD